MRKLSLENFKCFEKQEINFRKLTILAGANGSGKSTVIQAILLLIQSTERNYAYGDLLLNGYYFEAGSAKDLLYQNAKDETISLSITNEDGEDLPLKYLIRDKDSRVLQLEDFKNYKRDDDEYREILVNNVVGTTSMLSVELVYTDFISADRYGPQHTYKTNNDSTKIGKYGEFVPYIVDQHKLDILENTDVYFNSKTESSSLLTEINNWLGYILDDVRIDTSVLTSFNVSILKITNFPQTKLDFKSPIHMPYGASYVLPIIVACLHNSDDLSKKVIIENPEAHLHPAAQSKLGIFLAQIAAAGVQIIIETHSDHIINGIRLAIKKEKIKNTDVLFNSFNKGGEIGENYIDEIELQKDGRLNKWPSSFFDQYEKDMLDLL